MSNKITINRALLILKRFEESFNTELKDSTFGYVFSPSTDNGEVKNSKEAIKKIDETTQSLKDKLEYYRKVKLAVTIANNETYIDVPILGRVTINDVINYRQHVLPLQRKVVERMETHINQVTRVFENSYFEWEKKKLDLVKIIESKEATNLQKAYLEQLENDKPELVVDKEKLDQLKTLIKFLDLELDGTLSDINASTLIDVE